MLIGIVFVITVGAFYLIHLLPGDPAAVILGTGDSPANRAKLYRQLGLNKPIIEQYFVWIKNILRGNLGTSFITETSVWSTIKAALPIDIETIIISQILAFAFAIPTAMRSARKPDGVVDRILSAGSFTLLSVPSFVLIVVLVLVVAIKLGVPHTGPSSYVSLSAGLDWQPRKHGAPLHHAGHRELRGLLPRPAQRPHRHPARGVHHHGSLQGHQLSAASCGDTPFAPHGRAAAAPRGSTSADSWPEGSSFSSSWPCPVSATNSFRPSGEATISSSRASC